MPRISRSYRQSQKEDLNIQTADIHSNQREEDFTLTKANTLILLNTTIGAESGYILKTTKKKKKLL